MQYPEELAEFASKHVYFLTEFSGVSIASDVRALRVGRLDCLCGRLLRFLLLLKFGGCDGTGDLRGSFEPAVGNAVCLVGGDMMVTRGDAETPTMTEL